MTSENWSHKQSHKLDGIGVRRIRMLPFLLTLFTTLSLTVRSAYDLVKTRLSESEVEVEG